MKDTGAILCQISSFKDMLDQVNEEIEANIQITREIESEIVKCSELESALSTRESELTKSLYVSHFQVHGLLAVNSELRKSVGLLEEEVRCLRKKREEMLKMMDDKRENFTALCLNFQNDIDKEKSDEVGRLLSEKELLENEINLLDQKNNALKNSMMAFVEEVLQDLHDSNSALTTDVHNGTLKNDKLLREIDDLKSLLLSSVKHH